MGDINYHMNLEQDEDFISITIPHRLMGILNDDVRFRGMKTCIGKEINYLMREFVEIMYILCMMKLTRESCIKYFSEGV